MSVRSSLLAILDQGPCYGYQLRTEFDRRTGSTRALNVGQIYNTLDRLERDGLVVKGDTDEHGHVYYAITDAGSLEVSMWLDSPVETPTGTRDELAIKLAVAATLPGVDIAAVIATQRAASLGRHAALVRRRDREPDPADPEGLARALVIDSLVFAVEAELAWLDHAAALLARHPQRAMALALSTERPRRGRPSRTSSPA